MGRSIQSRLDQVKFVEIWNDMVCLGRPYQADHITSKMLRLSSTNFTWSVLVYFAPNVA